MGHNHKRFTLHWSQADNAAFKQVVAMSEGTYVPFFHPHLFIFLVRDLPHSSSEIWSTVLLLLIGVRLASGPSCSLEQPPLAENEMLHTEAEGCNVWYTVVCVRVCFLAAHKGSTYPSWLVGLPLSVWKETKMPILFPYNFPLSPLFHFQPGPPRCSHHNWQLLSFSLQLGWSSCPALLYAFLPPQFVSAIPCICHA